MNVGDRVTYNPEPEATVNGVRRLPISGVITGVDQQHAIGREYTEGEDRLVPVLLDGYSDYTVFKLSQLEKEKKK